ncbi:MAG TPA: glycosyltransferase 87 family protein [Acidobacteriaceae bacterium]|jgi:hypothetical protein
MERRGNWEIVGALFALVIALLTIAGRPETKDYLSYWSAGKLLSQHSDPYSVAHVLALEQTQGYTARRPLVMRNPPPSLLLALPLGWLSPRVGLILWVGIAFGCLVIFLKQQRVPPRFQGLAFAFTPFLICLITGQTSCFLLLGLSTFLTFFRSRPLLAGAALWLMTGKPHVFFLLWPLLLIDCLLHRRWRLMTGAVLTTGIATAIAMAFDPQVWPHYLAMLHAEAINNAFLTTPAFMLRYALNKDKVWIELIPAAFALIWAAWFYVRNRRVWDWSVHTAPLLLVCLATCPYVWMTDEVVLLPALMLALVWASPRKHAAAVLLLLSLIPFVMLMMKISLPTGAYVWTSIAWLAWYVYCRGWRVFVEPTDRLASADAVVTMQ